MKGDVKTLYDRGGRPRLSVVIVSPGGFSGVLPTMDALADQTIADQIEVLASTPTPRDFTVDEATLQKFHSFRVVDAGKFATRGAGAAPAVFAASADIIAFIENHAFPFPDWADILLQAHNGTWSGVCPRVQIYNPATRWSRSASFMDYGHWIRQERPTESEMLPWHNASYKREVLTQFGDELGVLLEPENRLQERLRAEGHRFFLDPRACILHVGSSTGEIALLSAVGRGREFAIDRRKTWGWPRRMIYALTWPLFPLIRFVQLRQQLLDYRQYSRVADLILPIGLILAAHSVGESLGYLWDLGRSQAYLFKHELLFEYRVKKSEQEELMRLARERISPVAGRVDD